MEFSQNDYAMRIIVTMWAAARKIVTDNSVDCCTIRYVWIKRIAGVRRRRSADRRVGHIKAEAGAALARRRARALFEADVASDEVCTQTVGQIIKA